MQKWKILCVDDELMNIKLYQAVFSKFSVEISTCDNGSEAWKKIQAERFDLIILDVMIPGLNGFDLCKRIKKDLHSFSIPVILVTSLSEKKFLLQGIESGCDFYLEKPYNKSILIAKVKALIKTGSIRKQFNEANQRLEKLSDYGLELISSFNPLVFNLPKSLDALATQILDVPANKASILLIGRREFGQWRWLHYETPFQELIRHSLNHPIESSLPTIHTNDSPFIYVDKTKTDTPLAKLIETLEQIPGFAVRIHSVQGYIQNDFVILILDQISPSRPRPHLLLSLQSMIGFIIHVLATQTNEAENESKYLLQSLNRASANIYSKQKRNPILVGELSGMLARLARMPELFIQNISVQAITRDIGNLLIPNSLLNKTGKLTFEEWEIIRCHPQYGADIIGTHPRLKMARTIALTHHENWDGTGYPYWLEGNRIPIEGRIISIADRYDALRTARPYKPAMDHESAINLMQVGDDRIQPGHFDPQLFKVFLENAKEFAMIYDAFQSDKRKNAD